MRGPPAQTGVKIRKVGCVSCYKFYDYGKGARCRKTWKEFCSQECLESYNTPGTLREDKHLAYAQQLLSSVETRPHHTGGVPTSAIRSNKVCSRKECSARIISMVAAVAMMGPDGGFLYCTKSCANKDESARGAPLPSRGSL
ncbi:hypothetical protein CYMTET_36983 [Cymbomonas tetramitiformis]|uniref:Uncharacterized protein n=1 Tax=Cymbomonas tetramitiformis TaxID=36881 RepID=A0AAE0BSI0_9CHLO|nr:hypothetical protein CYMTET_48321 [Cymbomonas tetramitiformis]KAK3253778.1 hypothetical protein CYMTET_36983 [Cymbomonas tetramitiformis]